MRLTAYLKTRDTEIFPYHSWAGGARDDLEYYVDFGTEVEVEKLVFYLRADFPHDTYWKNIDIEFSDGEIVTANFEGVADGQEVVLKEKKLQEQFTLQISYKRYSRFHGRHCRKLRCTADT